MLVMTNIDMASSLRKEESLPAKNAKKGFHSPGIKGLLPVFLKKATHETATPAIQEFNERMGRYSRCHEVRFLFWTFI